MAKLYFIKFIKSQNGQRKRKGAKGNECYNCWFRLDKRTYFPSWCQSKSFTREQPFVPVSDC